MKTYFSPPLLPVSGVDPEMSALHAMLGCERSERVIWHFHMQLICIELFVSHWMLLRWSVPSD
jgi:hypothetical protein